MVLNQRKILVTGATGQQGNNNKNNKNNNVDQFAAGTAVWQSLMTYWLNAYGEFLKNAPKMTEEWYNILEALDKLDGAAAATK
jgi:hypothetical protein